MYRVMLVEDEMLVRMGLKSSVDWADYGMQVVADFTNGQSALNYYKTDKPDIIVTDLRMHTMDGMTMIERIRETDAETYIIILSCLEEFQLIRRAMSIGVSDYILKLTMTEEEIHQVLSRAKAALDNRRKTAGNEQDGLTECLIEKDKLFKDFLYYGRYTADEFAGFAARLNLSGEAVWICCLEIDYYAKFQKRFDDDRGLLIRTSMLNVLEEELQRVRSAQVFHDYDGKYVVVFGAAANGKYAFDSTAMPKLLEQIRASVSLCFGVSLSVVVSDRGEGYSSLPALYTQASELLESRKLYLGTGMTCYPDTPVHCDETRAKLSALSDCIAEFGFLNSGQKQELKKRLAGLAQALPVLRNAAEKGLSRVAHYLLLFVGSEKDSLVEAALQFNESIVLCETLDDMAGEFQLLLSRVMTAMTAERGVSPEVAATIDYVRQHYAEDIRLSQLAGHIGLSPNYLSNRFKKELNVNFSDYLNQERIKQARKLLAETYLRSYEVAEQTGFSDHAYFSKVFKKLTGLSPNDFRKQAGGGVKC